MSAYPSLMSRSPRDEVVHWLYKAEDLARRIMQARHGGDLNSLEDELDDLLGQLDSRVYQGAKSLLEAADRKYVDEKEATFRRRMWDYISELSKSPATDRYRHVEGLLAELDRGIAPVESRPPAEKFDLRPLIRAIPKPETPVFDHEALVAALVRGLPADHTPAVEATLETLIKEIRGVGNKLKALGMPIITGPVPIEGGSFEVSNTAATPVPVSFTQGQVATAELEEITLLASAARSASLASDPVTNRFRKGVHLYLNVTATSGTLQTLDVKIQTKEPVSGTWVDLADAAFLQVIATGTSALVVYPGINQASSAATVRASNVMARTWRVFATIGGTTPSFTFSVAAVTLP